MKLCMSCMTEYPERLDKCPVCGSGAVNNPEGTLRAGRTLSGRYAIGKVLGKGALSISYLAKDRILGNIVVVKEYFPENLVERVKGMPECKLKNPDEEENLVKGIKNFAAKARLFAKFREYANSPTYYDVFRENNTVYYVREYVSGSSLSEIIEKKTLSYSERLDVIKQILFLLNKLHNLGVFHGAVKPNNIIVDENHNVLLTDFAIAGFTDEGYNYASKNIYSAPELYRDSDISVRSDVYSIAAVTYHAVTDKAPVDGNERILNTPMEAAIMHNPSLDNEANAAIMHGLTLDASERCENTEFFMKRLFANDSLDVYTAEKIPTLGETSVSNQKTMTIYKANEPARVSPIPAAASVVEDVPTAFADKKVNSVQAPATAGIAPAVPKADDERRSASAKAPKKKRKMKGRGIAVIAAVAVLLVGGGIFAAWKTGIFNRGDGATVDNAAVSEDGTVTVPELANKSTRADIAKLIEEGWNIVITGNEYNDDVAEGLVVAQTPLQGNKISANSTITVKISKGPKPIDINSLIGKKIDDESVADNIAKLEKIGFTVKKEEVNHVVELGTITDIEQNEDNKSIVIYFSDGSVTEKQVNVGDLIAHISEGNILEAQIELDDLKKYFNYDKKEICSAAISDWENYEKFAGYNSEINDYDEGQIICIDFGENNQPDTNSRVDTGCTITIYVNTNMIEIPDVEAMNVEEAVNKLEALGFEVDTERKSSNAMYKNNAISAQEPSAEEKVEYGSTVYLTVNKVEEKEETPSPTESKPENQPEEPEPAPTEKPTEAPKTEAPTANQVEVKTTTTTTATTTTTVATTKATTTTTVATTESKTEPPTEPPKKIAAEYFNKTSYFKKDATGSTINSNYNTFITNYPETEVVFYSDDEKEYVPDGECSLLDNCKIDKRIIEYSDDFKWIDKIIVYYTIDR